MVEDPTDYVGAIDLLMDRLSVGLMSSVAANWLNGALMHLSRKFEKELRGPSDTTKGERAR